MCWRTLTSRLEAVRAKEPVQSSAQQPQISVSGVTPFAPIAFFWKSSAEYFTEPKESACSTKPLNTTSTLPGSAHAAGTAH